MREKISDPNRETSHYSHFEYTYDIYKEKYT